MRYRSNRAVDVGLREAPANLREPDVRYAMGAIVVAVLCVAISGCAMNQPYSGGVPLTAGVRQRAIFERQLTSQITPPLDGPVKLLWAPLPDYRKEFGAGHLEFEGTIRVAYVIEPDGTVSDLSIKDSPPAPIAAAVLKAVRHWRFEPLRRNGEPVRERVMQALEFINFR